MLNDSIDHVFLVAAKSGLDEATAKICHCVTQLDDSKLWWRPTPFQNSIGNLILHLCGNVRQWIISGVGGAADVRDRPSEFAERPPIPKPELLKTLHACIEEAGDALAKAEGSSLLASRRIQGFDTAVLSAILDSISHFRGHTQEIISLTRQQLGDSYKFHWTPSTPEQVSGQRDDHSPPTSFR